MRKYEAVNYATINESNVAKPKHKSNFVASLGNFCVQYNFACVSIAVSFMTSSQDRVTKNDPTLEPDFPEPSWGKYTLLGLVFAGAVVGMCVMGYLGDLVGRRRAMLITLSFNFFGALGSAVFSWGSAPTVYAIVATCRFFLGMGVGGIYPLSAAQSAESTSEGEHAAKRVGWAFFWQTPGAMFPYLVALILLKAMPEESWTTSVQFRILLGLGALPALVVLLAEMRTAPDVDLREVRPNPFTIALRHPQYFWKLIGTGGSWFLYDVSYYGTAIFTPAILESIFGEGDSLFSLCWQSLVVSALGIPSCIIGVMLLKPKGARWLNLTGFYFIAGAFAALALTYNLTNADEMKELKFVLFCLVTFALNYGPNVATFVLPAEVYPHDIRTTFHGMSAAAAKLGAVAGTFMYTPIEQKFNIAAVMWVQVVLSLMGALVTHFFIDKKDEEELGSKLLGVDFE